MPIASTYGREGDEKIQPGRDGDTCQSPWRNRQINFYRAIGIEHGPTRDRVALALVCFESSRVEDDAYLASDILQFPKTTISSATCQIPTC